MEHSSTNLGDEPPVHGDEFNTLPNVIAENLGRIQADRGPEGAENGQTDYRLNITLKKGFVDDAKSEENDEGCDGCLETSEESGFLVGGDDEQTSQGSSTPASHASACHTSPLKRPKNPDSFKQDVHEAKEGIKKLRIAHEPTFDPHRAIKSSWACTDDTPPKLPLVYKSCYSSYVCTIEDENLIPCDAFFENIEAYISHLKSVHGRNPYLCQFLGCRQEFKTPFELMKHEEENGHTNEGVLCIFENCMKYFLDEELLQVHVDVEHDPDQDFTTPPPPLQPTPGNAYNHYIQVLHHADYVDETKPRRTTYFCKFVIPNPDRGAAQCGKCFKTQEDLVDHLRQQHEVNPYKCYFQMWSEQCGAGFDTDEELEEHKTAAGHKV